MSNRPNTRRRPGIPAGGSAGAGPPRWLRYAVGGLVLLAAVVAIVLTAGQSDAFEYGTVTVEGADLPELGEAGPDPAVGMAAPTVVSVTAAGTTRIEPGRPTVLVFLAHWCPHCQRELPVVQGWLDAGGLPEGTDLVSVLTLSERTRGNWPPDEWLEEAGWTPEVVVDDEDDRVARAFGLAGTPHWVAITADGTVAARASGELSTLAIDGLVAAARGEGESVEAPEAPEAPEAEPAG